MLKIIFLASFLLSFFSDTQAAAKTSGTKTYEPRSLPKAKMTSPEYKEEVDKIGELYSKYNNMPKALIPSPEGPTIEQTIEQARINKEFEDARTRFLIKHATNMAAINAYSHAIGML